MYMYVYVLRLHGHPSVFYLKPGYLVALGLNWYLQLFCSPQPSLSPITQLKNTAAQPYINCKHNPPPKFMLKHYNKLFEIRVTHLAKC